jgi:hypothetical protein
MSLSNPSIVKGLLLRSFIGIRMRESGLDSTGLECKGQFQAILLMITNLRDTQRRGIT